MPMNCNITPHQVMLASTGAHNKICSLTNQWVIRLFEKVGRIVHPKRTPSVFNKRKELMISSSVSKWQRSKRTTSSKKSQKRSKQMRKVKTSKLRKAKARKSHFIQVNRPLLKPNQPVGRIKNLMKHSQVFQMEGSILSTSTHVAHTRT